MIDSFDIRNSAFAIPRLYASAANGECPIQIDTSTPSCGHSRFGCWTCTVVERDNRVARAARLHNNDGNSRKRAQRSQRKTLRSVRSFAATPFRIRHSEFRISFVRADTLRRLLAKVDEHSESHRAFGLPDDLLNILKDDLAQHGKLVFN